MASQHQLKQATDAAHAMSLNTELITETMDVAKHIIDVTPVIHAPTAPATNHVVIAVADVVMVAATTTVVVTTTNYS
ncbi:MAG: hypothetical protein H0U71_08335 [Gammaproteobacteria bacterium]|nr:hypothetical protein [Gammaproteobacteria bacterium]